MSGTAFGVCMALKTGGFAVRSPTQNVDSNSSKSLQRSIYDFLMMGR